MVNDADAAEIADLVEVDNDNDPTPENIVQPGETVNKPSVEAKAMMANKGKLHLHNIR